MKYITLFIVLTLSTLLFVGCSDNVTSVPPVQPKVKQVNPSPDLTFFQSKTIYCNEFGMAYYRNVSDRHTSYIPVYKSSTEVATCKEMAELRNTKE